MAVTATLAPDRTRGLVRLLRETAEPIDDPEALRLDPLLDRLGRARVVLLGGASDGTAEVHRIRSRITRDLIARHGFTIVAVETAPVQPPVRRFPGWTWHNAAVSEFTGWLRAWNAAVREPGRRTGVHGLDLYDLSGSLDAVLEYLDTVDPAAARLARIRYGCLTPWFDDPAGHGRSAMTERYRNCEGEAVSMLMDRLRRRLEHARRNGDRVLGQPEVPRLVQDAERYYRAMYHGSAAAWNLRERHLFDTLTALLSLHGPEAKAVVWADNCHVGDSAATEMGARGEFNVGRLCRRAFGPEAHLVGFGTEGGTVAAAAEWGAPGEVMRLRPAHARSYERLCHDTEIPAFVLELREPGRREIREELAPARLERAIGATYRPESELASHYFQASLPLQFDDYIWFDRTSAVTPLPTASTSP